MTALLWWGGIGWETSIRRIGWTYIALASAVGALAWQLVQLWREVRGDQ